MVKRTAHNGQDIGSNPIRFSILNYSWKMFKYIYIFLI